MPSKITIVKRPTLISPNHLLRYIFFTELQVIQASKILNKLIENGGVYPVEKWEDFLYTSRGLYVKVMRKLRDIGMIEKKQGKFWLSQDFSRSLISMAEYWKKIIEAMNEGDRTITF